MPQQPHAELDMLKLSFVRDLVQAARDPQAESVPLMELAGAIVNSVLTPAMLVAKAYQPLTD